MSSCCRPSGCPALLAVVVTLAGCVPPPEVPAACFAEPPALGIGTGQSHHVPLDAGDPLEVIGGPQGGYHVYLSLRPRGVEPEVVVHVRLTDVETRRTLHDAGQETVLGEGPDRCTLETTGLLAVLDVTSADAVDGHLGEIDIRVSDEAGHVASEHLDVELVPWR